MKLLTNSAILVTMVLASVLHQTSTAQEMVQAGAPAPSFKFRQVVMNNVGRVRRDHYLGQPVLIEFWGSR